MKPFEQQPYMNSATPPENMYSSMGPMVLLKSRSPVTINCLARGDVAGPVMTSIKTSAKVKAIFSRSSLGILSPMPYSNPICRMTLTAGLFNLADGPVAVQGQQPASDRYAAGRKDFSVFGYGYIGGPTADVTGHDGFILIFGSGRSAGTQGSQKAFEIGACGCGNEFPGIIG